MQPITFKEAASLAMEASGSFSFIVTKTKNNRKYTFILNLWTCYEVVGSFDIHWVPYRPVENKPRILMLDLHTTKEG